MMGNRPDHDIEMDRDSATKGSERDPNSDGSGRDSRLERRGTGLTRAQHRPPATLRRRSFRALLYALGWPMPSFDLSVRRRLRLRHVGATKEEQTSRRFVAQSRGRGTALVSVPWGAIGLEHAMWLIEPMSSPTFQVRGLTVVLTEAQSALA